MELIKFDKSVHMSALKLALKRHEHPEPTLESIPAVGYTVTQNGNYVAFCFLRKVEGGFGQIDGLTSNPEITGVERNAALNLVVEACLDEAKAIGITHLVAFCEKMAPISRGMKYGFKVLPHALVALDLNREIT